MAKRTRNDPGDLKSWKQIAEYLHKSVNTVQRWAREGMPVRREGRYVAASPEDISRWLGEGEWTDTPVHLPAPKEDLATELRKSVTSARKQHRDAA
jgi:hypothetical protein